MVNKRSEQIDPVKREINSALGFTIMLTVIPIVAGTFAFISGLPLAVLFWLLIGGFHLLGVKLYLKVSFLGRYGLIVAMIGEGVNLSVRTISTNSWFDRLWLLPTALLTFWIGYVLIRYSAIAINKET